MVLSRRVFMKRGSLLVAAGVSLGSAERIFGRDTDSQSPAPQNDLLPTANRPAPFAFTKATFAPYVDSVFRIYPDSSRSLKSTLISIQDIGPVPDQRVAGHECFVLKFRGTEALGQNTYRIEHAVLGRFNLFLVPAGKTKKGVYYQAVINRLNG